jgi:AmmeMemoRadiSam system protein A
VTLRSHGALRGCIGYIESILPLANVVEEVAVKAALEDPRFPPLTSAEVKDMIIEVSVLSPLVRVKNIEEINVGVHGLLLELGPRRGLLLPQVATEYHWDRLAFLNATARKAGLPEDGWRHPEAKLYRFTAEIVEETEESQDARPS